MHSMEKNHQMHNPPDESAKKVAAKIRRVLDAAAAAGFTGGVFESHVWIGPIDGPNPHASTNFFAAVEEAGGVIVETSMSLDGGAGV